LVTYNLLQIYKTAVYLCRDNNVTLTKPTNNMEVVTAFKLSDGTLVDNQQTAVALQSEIDFKEGLRSLCDEIGFYETKDIMYNLILAHRNEFATLFSKS